MAAFRLTSPAFDHDAVLPARFHSAGGDVSPPLAWEGVPEGTKELLLVCEDPDADEGVLTHWVVYGIPPDATALPAGVPREAVVTEPVELLQGLNEFGEVGYSGPLEADERGPHRFFFRIYAVGKELLDVPPGVTRLELRTAAREHVIERAELVGIA